MKPYLEVIKERYDGRERNQQMYDNIYSIINPIGFNGHTGIASTIYKICRFLIKNDVDISSIRILDVGCGSGSVTRLLAEFTGNPSNIVGIDLSDYRIQSAKKFTQSIKYFKGDIVTGCEFSNGFDLITAFDVFMHLDTEEIVNKALRNVNSSLKFNGFFVWFDAYSKNHFDCPVDAECNGFSSLQMDKMANDAGFTKVYEFSLYKNMFGKIHSLYLYNKLPYILVKILEKIAIGHPGNIVKIFSKSI